MGYNSSPRSEQHGDSYYWVDRVPEGIRVRCKVGGIAYAEAQARTLFARSESARLGKIAKGLTDAIEAHKDEAILAELNQTLSDTNTKIERLSDDIESYAYVPEPYVVEKVVS